MKLLPKYGAITRLSVGPVSLIYLNSIESINYVLKKKESFHRPPFLDKDEIDRFGCNLLFTNGNVWEHKRKYIQRALFNIINTSYIDQLFGKLIKDNIIPAIDACIDKSELWFPQKYLTFLSFSAIYVASFGGTMSIDDELYQKFQDFNQKVIKTGSITFTLRNLPKIFRKIFQGIFERECSYIEAQDGIVQEWFKKRFEFGDEAWIKNGDKNKYYKIIKDIENKKNATFLERMLYFYHYDPNFNGTKKGMY